MSAFHKIGVSAIFLTGVVFCSYFAGRQHGREAALKKAVAAYQTRERINHETETMDADALCRALGGLPSECAALLRRMDETTQD